jgi:hypothetical protein
MAMGKYRFLKTLLKLIVNLLLLLVFINQTIAQKAGDVTIIDSRHYSQVFGEVRNYRIFLPPDYYSNPNKKYSVIYFYYGGMNVRLNYGDKDRLHGFHEELNKVWPQVMDNYEFKIYDAGHSACGLGDMFGFLLKTFENPPQKPLKWDHIDVYPEFSVWDYKVSTDRNTPGITVLENVDKRGFKCTVREFLQDGEILSFVNLSITTPALYEKNQLYIINDIDIKELLI